MKEMQEKKAYIQPRIEIVYIQHESLLNGASGNAGTIGQGHTVGDAKPGFLDESDEEENESCTSMNVWND